MRRSVVVMMAVLMVGTAMASLGVGGTAQGQEVPDPAFIEQVPGAPCKPESAFEKKGWKLSASHQAGDKCKRIQFAFGPITVKPGQNDVLIGPVTIEKPAYDGIITRFKPDLVDETGEAPPIDVVHLHHATWLNGGDSYGNGPFFAAGEEKTVLPFPTGYGMEVNADDPWLLLYMVHSDGRSAQRGLDHLRHRLRGDRGRRRDRPSAGEADLARRAEAADREGRAGHLGATRCSTCREGSATYDEGLRPEGVQRGRRELCPPRHVRQRHATTGQTHQARRRRRLEGPRRHGRHDRHDGWSLTSRRDPRRGESRPRRQGEDDPYLRCPLLGPQVQRLRRRNRRSQTKTVRQRRRTCELVELLDDRDGSSSLDWKVKIKKGDILRLNAVYDSENASWYENMGIVDGVGRAGRPARTSGRRRLRGQREDRPRRSDRTRLTPPGWRQGNAARRT